MRSLRTRRRIPLAAALASTSLAAVLALTAGAASAAPIPSPAGHVTPGAVAEPASAGAFVFYTATNGSVWTTDSAPGASPAIRPLGGRLVSAPAAIWAGDKVIVFGQGTDNELWATETRSYPSGWSHWQPLGGVLSSKPGAVDVDSTTYSVFARGTDGAVWERDHGGSAWDSWHSLGGRVLAGTGPAAAYTSAYNQAWVAVTGTDHAIWYRNLSSNIPQTDWASLQGKTTAGPALAAPASTPAGSALVAFARGTNNAGFYNEIIGGGQGWHSIGGRLTSGLAAAAPDSSGATWVFGLGTDNQVYGKTGGFPSFGAWIRVPT